MLWHALMNLAGHFQNCVFDLPVLYKEFHESLAIWVCSAHPSGTSNKRNIISCPNFIATVAVHVGITISV